MLKRIFINKGKSVLVYDEKQVELIALPTENGEKRLYAKTFFPKITEGYKTPQYKSNPDKTEDIEVGFDIGNGFSLSGESSEDGDCWWVDFPEDISGEILGILPLLTEKLQEGKDIQLSFQKSKNLLHVKEIETKKIR